MVLENNDRVTNQVYKGVFWIKDINNCKGIYSKIPCSADGEVVGQTDMPLNSKHGDNYNHKLTWDSFDKDVVNKKAFDYYPRGRVEIRKGVAKIFLNPHINGEAILETVEREFNLLSENGISRIKVIPDYSEHYHSYLDEESED